MTVKLIRTAAMATALALAALGGAEAGDSNAKSVSPSQQPSSTGTLPKENGQPSVKDLRGHDTSSDKPDASVKDLRGHSETPKDSLQRN